MAPDVMPGASPGNPEAGDYDHLPEAVKSQITPKEWMWLPDQSKAQFVQRATEPEFV